MTKKEMFARLSALHSDDKEIVDFCSHEIALLEKASSKPSKNQLANQEYKAQIVGYLSEHPHIRVAEMVAPLGLSSQKINSLLGQLINDGSVSRVEEKRVPYFSKA